MEGDYYFFEKGSTLGCDVAECVHPFQQTHKAFQITRIKRTCPEPRLEVGDIITHMNGKQVSSMHVFGRKFGEDATLRVFNLREVIRFQQQQQQERQHQQQQPQQQPPPPPPRQPPPPPPPPLAPVVVTDRPSDTTRKRQRDEHHDAETKEDEGEEEEEVETPHRQLFETPPQPPPPQEEGFCTPVAANIPQEPPKVREEKILLHPSLRCEGLTKAILSLCDYDDIDKILRGFDILRGNAMRTLASTRNIEECAETTIGFIINNNKKDEDGYAWEVVRMGNTISFHREICRKNVPHGVAKDVDVADGTNTCCECYRHRGNFVKMCRKENELYEVHEQGDVALKNHKHVDIKYKSPTLVMPLLKDKSRQIKVLNKKLARREKWKKQLKKDGIYISNINAAVLFEEKELQRCYDQLMEKGEIEDEEMFSFLFQECMVISKRVKRHGSAKGHIYSPLLIQFSVMLRDKCSASTYDFFRKAFNLPTNRTLCRYSNADSTSPDGLMMETIIQMDSIYNGLKIPELHWKRTVNLGWDSHV